MMSKDEDITHCLNMSGWIYPVAEVESAFCKICGMQAEAEAIKNKVSISMDKPTHKGAAL